MKVIRKEDKTILDGQQDLVITTRKDYCIEIDANGESIEVNNFHFCMTNKFKTKLILFIVRIGVPKHKKFNIEYMEI